VAAPAGSTLTVDLRPLRKGTFTPTLAADLSDGSAGAVPLPDAKGKTKAVLPFPVDGTLELRVGAAGGGAGDYRLKTRLKAPRAWKGGGSVSADETTDLDFFVPPGSTAKVKVTTTKLSFLVPRISGISGPGGPPAPFATKPTIKGDSAIGVVLDDLGPWTLSVGGEDGSFGIFYASAKWKVAKGPNEDHRDAVDLGVLSGPYAALLTVPPVALGTTPSVYTGGVDFDGKGGAATDLRVLSAAPDPDGPLGVGVAGEPVAGKKGVYFTDGSTAALAFDLGGGTSLAAEYALAAGGSILHTGVGVPGAPAVGMLLATVPVPTREQLEGAWLYVDVRAEGAGSTSLEVGEASLSAAGTVAAAGLRTAVTIVDGTPTPGSQTPVLRSGSFAVAKDGTVTLVTSPNLGPSESWKARTAYGADVLAWIEPDGSGMRLLVRKGTGLSNADAAGNYLHFGASFGSSLLLRTGTLALDGAGAFAGTESVTDLGSGVPGSAVASSGSYSIASNGVATFAVDGGSSGTGVVGPGALYLFTVAADANGVTLDLLLDAE
jgi:hypothetical protein